MRVAEDAALTWVPTLVRRATSCSVFDSCIEPLLESVNTAEPVSESGSEAEALPVAEIGVTMTVWTFAEALPVFFNTRLREPLVRVAEVMTTLLLVWSTNAVHQACPLRVVFAPTWSDADVTTLGGSAVAFALALIMN